MASVLTSLTHVPLSGMHSDDVHDGGNDAQPDEHSPGRVRFAAGSSRHVATPEDDGEVGPFAASKQTPAEREGQWPGDDASGITLSNRAIERNPFQNLRDEQAKGRLALCTASNWLEDQSIDHLSRAIANMDLDDANFSLARESSPSKRLGPPYPVARGEHKPNAYGIKDFALHKYLGLIFSLLLAVVLIDAGLLLKNHRTIVDAQHGFFNGTHGGARAPFDDLTLCDEPKQIKALFEAIKMTAEPFEDLVEVMAYHWEALPKSLITVGNVALHIDLNTLYPHKIFCGDHGRNIIINHDNNGLRPSHDGQLRLIGLIQEQIQRDFNRLSDLRTDLYASQRRATTGQVSIKQNLYRYSGSGTRTYVGRLHAHSVVIRATRTITETLARADTNFAVYKAYVIMEKDHHEYVAKHGLLASFGWINALIAQQYAAAIKTPSSFPPSIESQRTLQLVTGVSSDASHPGKHKCVPGKARAKPALSRDAKRPRLSISSFVERFSTDGKHKQENSFRPTAPTPRSDVASSERKTGWAAGSLKPSSARTSSTKLRVTSSSPVRAHSSDIIHLSSSSDSEDNEVTVLSSSSENEAPARTSKQRLTASGPTHRASTSSSAASTSRGSAPKGTRHPTGAHSVLWTDLCTPETADELAVHPRKIEDVRRWLREALEPGKLAKYRRLLVLSGPTGSGKTAVIRVLAKELGADLVEFKTGEEDGADSLSRALPSFLARVAQLPQLSFVSIDSPKEPIRIATPQSREERRKIILVEDLPNIFSSQVTRETFRAAILNFVASRRIRAGIPLVLIISEAQIRSSTDEEQGILGSVSGSAGWQSGPSTGSQLSVRSVVPPDALGDARCLEIKFNAIAPTIMKKALARMIESLFAANRHLSESIERPTAAAIDLATKLSGGDIRGALMNLQFASGAALRDLEQRASKLKLSSKRKRGKSSRDLGDVIHLRESPLFIFHALGKILYSKRWGENAKDDAKGDQIRPKDPFKLPKHLIHMKREPLRTNVDAMLSDMPVDSDMFMAYLHQNYPPFMNEIEESASAMDWASQADALLRHEADKALRHPLISAYTFQVGIRGMAISLPCPVPRRGQKLYKAKIWEVQKEARENGEAMIDLSVRVMREAATRDPLRASAHQDLKTLASITLPYMAKIGGTSNAQTNALHALTTFTTATDHETTLDERDMASDDEDLIEPIVAQQIVEQPALDLEDDEILEFDD
ncbi:uncharacterized protein L969DRAFT_91813 [Mixia osmundae IAM 14324]|uniref:AAA+ ATPase domain-containing protein n=1 Tax=Mixia osmundae (strain CBS 9802 / IAM 14324 / JCM 22182 / KY 12970) TaxID=764103 RepID=G7EAL2_MIXOS|nr:uncharacterized protein L969DRAFT_91813 [Mixia osmundae IAM 14324]KEI42362.1 hypothetical protein L969DRAFT_91813 [Mixia osmundae IAM 14324]GAA99872.1 hypothetical protein E5Q_06575 [Mixia osmundae IAM 14324]